MNTCTTAFLVACAATLGLTMSPAGAADPIGLVKTLSGTANVDRAGAVQPLTAGADVFASDVLLTGGGGSLGITFRDDTTLSMGPNGRMAMEDFAFDPAREDLKMRLNLLKGTFAVTTGQIARLAPDALAVKTPIMSIGVRGTSFLVEVSGDE